MMDQTHIGYTYWQEPPANAMPEVREVTVPAAADMGVALEGSGRWWPSDSGEAALPEFDPYREPSRYVDVFNRGQAAFEFRAVSGAPWLVVSPSRGKVETEQRLQVSVDWRRAPVGDAPRRIAITLTGAGRSVVVYASVRNPAGPRRDRVRGFVEGDGYVSMEAEHYARAVAAAAPTEAVSRTPASAAPIHWVRIPGLGRTVSGMTAFPVTAARQTPGADSPHLEYRVYLFAGGDVTVQATFSPTLDFHATGLRYAVSLDDEAPQTINIAADTTLRAWEKRVSDNAIVSETRHRVAGAGWHVLRYWLVDPGLVLQKLVVARTPVPPSYLGPPESFRRP